MIHGFHLETSNLFSSLERCLNQPRVNYSRIDSSRCKSDLLHSLILSNMELISFLPQFTVQFSLVFCFSQDLVFCIFLQTVAFVAFNKVITAQYFVWFYCLLPLILPWSRMKLKWEDLLCIIVWIGAQIHWLLWGYMLEFKGCNVFLQLWIAGLLFPQTPSASSKSYSDIDSPLSSDVMTGSTPEGTQFDTLQFDHKLNEVLEGQDEFFTSYDEVHESFDAMGLQENPLRGIYAYGLFRSATEISLMGNAFLFLLFSDTDVEAV